MEQVIYIKYRWNTDSCVRAYKYHKKSHKYFWLSRFIVFGMGIINLLFGIFRLLSQSPSPFTIFQLFIGLLLLSVELINSAVYRFRCKQLNYDNREVEWEIKEEQITHRMINLSESSFTWELIQGILDTPNGFLLYPQRNLFYFIPKDGFAQSEDIAQFVYIAQDKVKNWQRIN